MELQYYIIFIILFLIPIISFIIRKVSPPLSSNYWNYLNDISFYGTNKFIYKNNSINNNILIKDYKNIRLFTQTKYNQINFYFTLLNSENYDDERFEFSITLYTNKSLIIYDNISISYIKNFDKEYSTTFKYTKHFYRSILEKKIKYLLDSIKIKYIKNENNTFFECKLSFKDFDLILNLKKEKFTYRFFYLFECLFDLLFYFIMALLISRFDEKNNQNLCIIYLLCIRAKILLSFLSDIYDLFKVGVSFIKYLIFYFHLVIYGEFLLSLIDIVSLIFLVILIFFIIVYFINIYDNDGNIFYCYNNTIINGKIVKKNIKLDLLKQKLLSSVIFFIISIFDYSNSIYIKFIPLYISISISIIKYLFQRESIFKKDKEFCFLFYLYGIIIYLYFLMKFNLGVFYRTKPTFAILPFINILLLYSLLIFIIKNEYKVKYIMKEDFQKIKEVENDCCSICLKDFKFNKNNDYIFFCKITEEDNIHKTKCHHYFHEKCLFNWRKHKNICPICKTKLDIPKYYYFYDENPCIYYLEFS